MRVASLRDVAVLNPFQGLVALTSRDLASGAATAELAPATDLQPPGIRLTAAAPERQPDQCGETQDGDNRRENHSRRGTK